MGHPFFSISEDGTVPEKVPWDGFSDNGDLVESAMQYTVKLEIIDEYERITNASAIINTDIQVIEIDETYNIRIPNISFAPFSASLFIKDSIQLRTYYKK